MFIIVYSLHVIIVGCVLLREYRLIRSFTSKERVCYRVRSDSRFEYPSDTFCTNDRSGVRDLGDDYEFDIRIRDELTPSMWSGLWLCYTTDGAHTRAKMIVR